MRSVRRRRAAVGLPRRRGTGRGERGSALPFLVACLGLLLVLGAALGVVASLVVAHRSAQSAADLAALAGARTLADTGDGCAAAGRVADRNGARLVACEVAGADLTVQVVAPGPRWLGQRGDLEARARAGPSP